MEDSGPALAQQQTVHVLIVDGDHSSPAKQMIGSYQNWWHQYTLPFVPYLESMGPRGLLLEPRFLRMGLSVFHLALLLSKGKSAL